MTPEINIFGSKLEVAENFARELQKTINKKEKAHISLSGGSTPKTLFDYLANEYADGIHWRKAHFYWGDERCVPPDDADSNYKMTKGHLFDKVAVPAENIHRIHGENDPGEEVLRHTDELADLVPIVNGLPQFDLIILGMGDDGHTASIFPHQMELLTSPNILEIAAHPTSGQNRITLTGPVINNALHVAFLVTGTVKAEKIKEIFSGSANATSYPAAHITAQERLSWYLDDEAASLLS